MIVVTPLARALPFWAERRDDGDDRLVAAEIGELELDREPVGRLKHAIRGPVDIGRASCLLPPTARFPLHEQANSGAVCGANAVGDLPLLEGDRGQPFERDATATSLR